MTNYSFMNTEQKINTAIFFLTGLILISSCTARDQYDRKLKEELASGNRSDTLFMGLYLGMPEKEFYTRCWELNKSGAIRQGATNTTVMYEVKKELDYPCTMDFYPRFNNGKIFEMPVRFKYKGWAPWNKKLASEKLQSDLVDWYEDLYGRGFIRVKHPEHGLAYVKLDGNRRITVFRQDEMHVWAVFTDMLVKNDWSGVRPDSLSGKKEQ